MGEKAPEVLSGICKPESGSSRKALILPQLLVSDMKEAAVLHPRLWVAAESTTPNFFMWSQLPTVARVLIDANYVEDSLQDKFILPVNWKLVLHVKLYACQVGCLPIFQKPFFFK